MGPTSCTAPVSELHLGVGRRPEAVVGVPSQGIRGARSSELTNEVHSSEQMGGRALPIPTMDQIRRDTGISPLLDPKTVNHNVGF